MISNFYTFLTDFLSKFGSPTRPQFLSDVP